MLHHVKSTHSYIMTELTLNLSPGSALWISSQSSQVIPKEDFLTSIPLKSEDLFLPRIHSKAAGQARNLNQATEHSSIVLSFLR